MFLDNDTDREVKPMMSLLRDGAIVWGLGSSEFASEYGF
jgi:hypothetical protein